MTLSSPKIALGDQDRAKDLFNTCIPCHGESGEGRPHLEAPAIAGMEEWYILNQLNNFRKGGRGTHGDDAAGIRMRPLARTLPKEEDVKSIATYVSKLKKSELAITVEGRPLLGQKAYNSTCVACHGVDGRGNRSLNAPSLLQTNDWYLLNQLKKFKAGIRAGDASLDPIGATMAPMAQTLATEQDMKDIVRYIQGLR